MLSGDISRSELDSVECLSGVLAIRQLDVTSVVHMITY